MYFILNSQKIRHEDKLGALQEADRKRSGLKPDPVARDMQDIYNKMLNSKRYL